MLELFNKNTREGNPDVKMIREVMLRFIKKELRKLEGGEAAGLKALHLFIASSEQEKHIYEAAVYQDDENRFKNEIQKIADDFAISLADDWALTVSYKEEFPAGTLKIDSINAGIIIETRKNPLVKRAVAYLLVLNGEAEKISYQIASGDGKINIGADKKVQGADGFFRINQIAFPSMSKNESNKYISRQHAHISFSPESGEFLLFADAGGIPPGNKVKVLSGNDSSPVKLLSTQTGYTLHEGDQIMLGESAILQFTYTEPT